MLPAGLSEQMRDLLLLHHSTLYTRQKRRAKPGQQLHLIRSLADIGKRHSAKDVNKCKFTKAYLLPPRRSAIFKLREMWIILPLLSHLVLFSTMCASTKWSPTI